MLKSPFWDFFDNLAMYHKFPNHFKIRDIQPIPRSGKIVPAAIYLYPADIFTNYDTSLKVQV
jgi:hypothetical protein